MPPELVILVNSVVVPVGLTAIMFSMGLSLRPRDFSALLSGPRAVLAGLAAQLFLLPLLGIGIAALFQLPPAMATGLFILAICPAGVTSNAITFVARGNVALSVVLTAITSIVTVVTVPLLLSWALSYYYMSGEAPAMSAPATIIQLIKMTLVPIAVGMLVRHFGPGLADRLGIWLRPASLVVLICVIAFSVAVSAALVWDNLLRAGPAAWMLNVVGMAAGLLFARLAGADARDSMTIGIEVGVQNATMATFLSLSILGSLELAITPTIYGCIMVLNAAILVRWFRGRARAEGVPAKMADQT